jgi:aquaporin-4
MFWKAVLAELLGTMLLVFIGCAVCLDNLQKSAADQGMATAVQISLAFGLAVATIVMGIGHVSGGHINPAVTVGMLVTRKITVIRACFYILVQFVGAIAGAGLLWLLHPQDDRGGQFGRTMIGVGVTRVQAFLMEMVITFVLVFTIFASCDKHRSDITGSIPLTIGLSVTLCHLFAIKYTGSSMNPARSLGPAVLIGVTKNILIYIWGPIAGGVLAALLYDLVFAADASLQKFKGYFTLAGPEQQPAEARKSAAPTTQA